MRIIPVRRTVGCTITLSTRLDPDKCVLDSIARLAARADSKPSPFNIAPVTPRILLGGLDSIAS